LLDRSEKYLKLPIVGLKGYATFFDAGSHEELLELLRGNPMHPVEEYRIFPLGEFPPKSIG
ncbi:MAG: hypothetical protein ACREP6_01665, partial [Candidatus Binataceae bacterium]